MKERAVRCDAAEPAIIDSEESCENFIIRGCAINSFLHKYVCALLNLFPRLCLRRFQFKKQLINAAEAQCTAPYMMWREFREIN
jgi:hypothetical protein